MIEVGIFALGVVFGAVLVRYGVGLGFKMFYQAKEDMPLSDNSSPIEQSNTEDEPISQESTEIL